MYNTTHIISNVNILFVMREHEKKMESHGEH